MRFAIYIAQLLCIVFGTVIARGSGSCDADFPNVIIFYTDDQGYGERSKFNPDVVRTPNIELLASQGIDFMDGHAASVVCTPSRFALLTGVYAFRKNSDGGAIGPAHKPLLNSYTTLGHLFRRANYRTYMVGKWHLGLRMPKDYVNDPVRGGPLDHGFDEFFGLPASMNYGHLAFIRDNYFVEPPSNRTRDTDGMHHSCPVEENADCSTFGLLFPYVSGSKSIGKSIRTNTVLEECIMEAMAMINSHMEKFADQNFFMYLAITSPHLPHAPHPDFDGRTSYGQYADVLEEIDYRLGQILGLLKNLGIYNSTFLIFTSDNGTNDKRKFVSTGFDTTGNLRGQKRSPFEGGHRVPFIFHWPDVINASLTTKPVSQVDFFATFEEMLNLSPDSADEKDSTSFWPIICDPQVDVDYRSGQPLIVEDNSAGLVILCNGFKYIESKSDSLYDLNAAEDESVSYSLSYYPDLAAELLNIVTEFKKNGYTNLTVCPEIRIV